MSWFDDCPFTKEEFHEIQLYLMMLRLRGDLYSIDKLESLVQKFIGWLEE